MSIRAPRDIPKGLTPPPAPPPPPPAKNWCKCIRVGRLPPPPKGYYDDRT